MALKLDILANTRQFVAESKKAGSSLDDIGDSLEDVAREARTTGDKTERAIDDIGDAAKDTARDIDTAGDKMERTFRELVKDAKKTDTAIGKVGDVGKKGFGKANDAAGEFKDEALSNFSEVTSSFDGSMSSIQDLAQGTLGGLASTGIPGVGLAAGIAAIAVGAIGSAIGENDEAMQASAEAAAQWADAYVASGGRIVDSAHVVAEIQAIATDPERYKKAKQDAEDWGVDVSDAMRAIAGDATALEVVQRSLAERSDEATAALKTQEGQVDKNAGATYDLADSVERGQGSLAKLTGEMRTGQAIAKNSARALGDYAKEAGVATGKTDSLGNAIYELPDSKQIVVDAKTGRAYEDIEALDRKKLGDKTVDVKVKVDDRAWRAWVPTVKEGIVVGKSGNKNWQIG